MQIQGKIAFLHEDTPYIRELTTYMVCSNNLYFQIHEFHTTNDYIEQMASAESNLTKEFDVVLLSEKIIQEERSFAKTCLIGKITCIVLTEVFVLQENIDFIAENDLYRAVKYQSIEVLSKYILSIIQKTKKWLMTQPIQEVMKVIGVYSPSGGVGKTTVSIAMADIFNKLGKKTIYMPLSGMEVNVGMRNKDTSVTGNSVSNDGKRLTDWIYGLKSQAVGYKVGTSKLLTCIQTRGSERADYMAPVEVFEELDEMDQDILKESINLLKESAGYETIIFDIESRMTRRTLAYLGLCDEIWLLSDGSEMAIEKERIWRRQVERIGQLDFLHKCRGVLNQYSRQDSGEGMNRNMNVLPFQRQLCRIKEEQLIVDTSGVFGESLMKLIVSESVGK